MTAAPDLTTPEGLQVASDMLQERGWPRCEMTLEGLWSVCPDGVLHELACRYAERVLPVWEQEHPDDLRPREAIEAKRAWVLGGVQSNELLDARHQASGSVVGRVRVDFSTAEACAVIAARAATQLDAAEAAADSYRAAQALVTKPGHLGSPEQARLEQLALTIAYMLEVGPA